MKDTSCLTDADYWCMRSELLKPPVRAAYFEPAGRSREGFDRWHAAGVDGHVAALAFAARYGCESYGASGERVWCLTGGSCPVGWRENNGRYFPRQNSRAGRAVSAEMCAIVIPDTHRLAVGFGVFAPGEEPGMRLGHDPRGQIYAYEGVIWEWLGSGTDRPLLHVRFKDGTAPSVPLDARPLLMSEVWALREQAAAA